MIGRQDRWQEDLFVAAPLSSLVPDDHILKRVDRVLDLSWLRDEVRDTYCENNGRPSIDPEAAVRLMLAGFFHGIVHDRKLIREARVNLAIRWFAGFRLSDKLPSHSSLTHIRQRWGVKRFKRIFRKTVALCVEQGLVTCETVHFDATLIRADVSWKSLTRQHARRVLEENREEPEDPVDPKGPRSGTGRPKKRSTTDPDATLTTSSHNRRLEPSYKQHTAVDDRAGVVVDVRVTTGEANEGRELPEQVDRVETTTGKPVKTVTADKGYSHATNYQMLEERKIEAVIPPQDVRPRVSVPLARFRYDARHRTVTCPGGKRLRRAKHYAGGTFYYARSKDCARCALRHDCVPQSAKARTIKIKDGYEALLRARRRRARWGSNEESLYKRHRWRVEGVHGEAKTQHGLCRAVRRRIWNVEIQAYLTAAAINLKRLAAFFCALFRAFLALWRPHALLRLRFATGLDPSPA